ncbi:hypothetical protein DFH09DRAFT_1088905 [Mycena vulgaris]|nr:hypothetical protein DFH09DRAFT_1088905 [Mycena vulgaris]
MREKRHAETEENLRSKNQAVIKDLVIDTPNGVARASSAAQIPRGNGRHAAAEGRHKGRTRRGEHENDSQPRASDLSAVSVTAVQSARNAVGGKGGCETKKIPPIKEQRSKRYCHRDSFVAHRAILIFDLERDSTASAEKERSARLGTYDSWPTRNKKLQ